MPRRAGRVLRKRSARCSLSRCRPDGRSAGSSVPIVPAGVDGQERLRRHRIHKFCLHSQSYLPLRLSGNDSLSPMRRTCPAKTVRRCYPGFLITRGKKNGNKPRITRMTRMRLRASFDSMQTLIRVIRVIRGLFPLSSARSGFESMRNAGQPRIARMPRKAVRSIRAVRGSDPERLLADCLGRFFLKSCLMGQLP